MPSRVDEVLKEAMEMAPADRALLAERLIGSLEPNPDADVEAASQVEIARRLHDIDSGQATLLPWETVPDQLRKGVSSN